MVKYYLRPGAWYTEVVEIPSSKTDVDMRLEAAKYTAKYVDPYRKVWGGYATGELGRLLEEQRKAKEKEEDGYRSRYKNWDKLSFSEQWDIKKEEECAREREWAEARALSEQIEEWQKNLLKDYHPLKTKF